MIGRRAVGVGVLLLVSGCAREAPRSVILVSLDTVRADRLGSYGSAAGLTPHLDALAAESIQFEDVSAAVPLTTPSHATMLTGLLPQRHGIRNNESFVLAPGVPTLAGVLAQAGYRTGAFVGAYPLHSRFGLARGFEVYDDAFLDRTGVEERSADEVLKPALAFIEQAGDSGRPFFAFIHLFDAHSPYEPPQPFRERFEDDPYGGEIASVDDALGRFFSALREEGRLEGVVLSVVSDHGEALGEHGETTHGPLIYQGTIRVPWILRLPGGEGAGRVVRSPVRLADLTPTLLSAAGAPRLEDTDGIDLMELLNGGGVPADLPVYSESMYLHLLLGWAELRGLRRGDEKFIDAPVPELYDLASDPGETENVIQERRSAARKLVRELRALEDEVPAGESAADTAERLASLGYLGGETRADARSGRNPNESMAIWRALESATAVLARDPERAREHVRHALELDPKNGLALKLSGDIELAAGAPGEALERYQDALAAGFSHPDLELAIARAERRAGRPEKALAVIAPLDATPEALLERAEIEIALGRHEEAARTARRLLSERPESVPALTLLGESLRRSGRLDEAEETLRRALSLDGADARALNEVGALLGEQGRSDEAQAYFREAIRLAPDAPEPRLNLARMVGGEESLALLREALAIRPDLIAARVELAKRLAENGAIEEAAREVERAVAAAPSAPEAVFIAARIAELRGRREEAVRGYRRFLELAPGHLGEARRMAEERLAALGR